MAVCQTEHVFFSQKRLCNEGAFWACGFQWKIKACMCIMYSILVLNCLTVSFAEENANAHHNTYLTSLRGNWV